MSVRRSVTRRYSVNTAEHILSFFTFSQLREVRILRFCARRIDRPVQNLGSCAEFRKIYEMAQKMRKFCRGKMSVSVCLSVRPSHAVNVCKRLYGTYPQFFHHRVAPPFEFFHTKRDDNIPTWTPQRGRRMQGGIKIMIFDQYRALSWN